MRSPTNFANIEKVKLMEEGIMFAYFTKDSDIYSDVKSFIKLQPVYYDANKIWWVWSFKTHSWLMRDEVDIINYIDAATTHPTSSQNIKYQILDCFKRIGRKNKPKKPKPHWVQFRSKIIDVVTMEVFDASPEYFISNPIDRDLVESSETPIIDRIFKEWVGEDWVITLKEILAYCMLPDYPIQRLFCLTGSGSNGKSCFLDLLVKIIGKENMALTDLDVLLSNRFESSKLYKKLVCIMGETDFNELKRTHILKSLTGDSLIRYEFKNKNPFDAANYAKIIISTNSLPTTRDKSDAYYRRWLIVDFPNRFNEKKDILSEIPEAEYNNLLYQLIQILHNLLKVREFSNEGTIEVRRDRYEERANPLGKFLKEHTKKDINGHVFKFEFIEKFMNFLNQNGYRIWNKTEIGRKMNEEFESGKMPYQMARNGKFETKYYLAWVGVKWK